MLFHFFMRLLTWQSLGGKCEASRVRSPCISTFPIRTALKGKWNLNKSPYTIQQLVENMEICTTRTVSNISKQAQLASMHKQEHKQKKRYKIKQNKYMLDNCMITISVFYCKVKVSTPEPAGASPPLSLSPSIPPWLIEQNSLVCN